MPALSVSVPFPVFQDRDGQPLDNGYVYIGVANLDAQTNPVQVYFDEALTIPAAQPLRTINGYVSNAGTPAQLYVNADNFSIKLLDAKGTFVYSFLNGTRINSNSSGVSYTQGGTGAVPTTVQTKLRESVSVLDFGGDPSGVSSSSAAIVAAQDYLASIGGGTLYFPPGEYKVTTPIVMKPGITYRGPMRAELNSYNPNRSRIFSSTGNIFINSASQITGVCFRDLYIESEAGGGHIFNWDAAGVVAKIEMSGVCLAQRNASKCVIYGVAAGGVFSIWLHDFEYVYVPACLFPPIWIASFTVNSIVIENFWSTANGQSAAGNPSIWVESTNAGGTGFNVTIRQGVFEFPGSGSIVLKSITNSTIEDCTVYDLTITPGYYQFAILKGATGPASSACSIRRCRSAVGTAGVPDLFLDMSVGGQGNFIVEQCTFLYADGSVSSQGSKVTIIDSSITNKANFPYIELGNGPTNQVHWGATAGTSADVAIWNGYPGNFDGTLNVTVNGVRSGSISKTGLFAWGNSYIDQAGSFRAGKYIYPGTPAGAQQTASGLLAGTGVPTGGNNGDFYFRGDGGTGTSIYMKRAGVWVAIV